MILSAEIFNPDELELEKAEKSNVYLEIDWRYTGDTKEIKS